VTDEQPLTWRYTATYEYLEAVRRGLPPMMICVACNGGVQGKEYNPALPETPEEIADSVYGAYRAGASMVHVHARHPGNTTKGATRAEHWWEVNRRIRERCPDIVINNTTGGDYEMTMEERLSCLDARPELASLNLTPDMVKFHLKARSAPLPFARAAHEIDECLPFTYKLISEFARKMRERKVRPEIEIYHPGGHWVIADLVKQGLIEPPFLIQTVMGVQTTCYPTPQHLLSLLADLPERSVWLCSGVGVHQLNIVTMAVLMGGHARVGLEDNVYERRGKLWPSNAAPVERIASIARALNRDIATPSQARAMLGLSATPTRYD
jgi:3-keto-5-aminohexanoate cleavage enzyme